LKKIFAILLLLNSFLLSQNKVVKLDGIPGYGTSTFMSVSPGNNLMAITYDEGSSSADGFIKLLELVNFRTKETIAVKDHRIDKARFSKSGRYLSYCSENKAYIYDIQTKKTQIIAVNKNYYISDAVISPDENFIAIGMSGVAMFSDGYLAIYDIRKSSEVLGALIKGGLSTIEYFNFGDRIAVGCERRIEIYETSYLSLVKKLEAHKFIIIKIIISDDDKTMITKGRQDVQFNIWDMDNYSFISGWQMSEYSDLIGFSPDNKKLFLQQRDDDNKLSLWNWQKQKGSVEIQASFPIKLTAFGANYQNMYYMYTNELVIEPLESKIPRSKLFSKRFKSYFDEIELAYKYYKLRDEFESIPEYITRAKQFNEGLYSIKKKYLDEVDAEEQGISNEIDARINELNDKITASIRDTLITVDKIGEYNIDKFLMPITIKGVTKNIRMNVEEAKTFKANYKEAVVRSKCKFLSDLKTLDYYDIIIVHPVSKNEYKFE
jgi:WD40 repeat protein